MISITFKTRNPMQDQQTTLVGVGNRFNDAVTQLLGQFRARLNDVQFPPELFEGLAQFAAGEMEGWTGKEIYENMDFSAPEDQFTLTLETKES